MKSTIVWLIASAVLLLSCGGTTAKNAEAGTTEIVGKADCIPAYADKMDQWLTPALAAEAAGLPAASMQTKYSRVMKNPAYHELSYSWNNGRLNSDPEFAKYKAKIADRLTITGIRSTTIEKFRLSRKPATAEALAKTDQVIDDVYDNDTHNDDIEAAKKKVREAGVDREQAKSASKTMTGAFKKVAGAYVAVEGIGQAAAWNTIEKKLYVFQNNAEFQVLADLSDDDATNKAKAIALARKLLSNCR